MTSQFIKDLLRQDTELAQLAPVVLWDLVREQPHHAADVVDALQILLETPAETYESDGQGTDSHRQQREQRPSQHRQDAARILGYLAGEHPELVGPTIDSILELCDADTEVPRQHALFAIGRLATETPADTEKCVEEGLKPALDAETEEARAAAVWALADITMEESAVVAQVAPVVQDRHDGESPDTGSKDRQERLNAFIENNEDAEELFTFDKNRR